MSTFTIDSDCNITARAGLPAGTDESQSFSTANELAKLTADWPASRLVEIWNSFAGVAPFDDLKAVKKFTSRKAAVARIWEAVQRLSPDVAQPAADVAPVKGKAKKSPAKATRRAGAKKILLTERGTTFGYNNLVADMRSIPILKRSGFPVIFDATHSVQLPGGGGDKSSGQREFAPVLARCALAAGANGLFIETHPRPERALSDGPNMIPLAEMPALLRELLKVFNAVKR